MPEKFYLQQFYVVTREAVYEIKAHDPPGLTLTVTKIAGIGQSKSQIGEKMLACSKLAVSDRHNWRGEWSDVVAHFTYMSRALECLRIASLVQLDPRWKEETKKVLRLIPDDHPAFYVPREEWSTFMES
jgi:hypothetical protein